MALVLLRLCEDSIKGVPGRYLGVVLGLRRVLPTPWKDRFKGGAALAGGPARAVIVLGRVNWVVLKYTLEASRINFNHP